MRVIGTDLLKEVLQQPGYFCKAIFNDAGVAFFSGKTQHNSVKIDGLSYEDDYKGNALAAIITDGRIEIRNHRDFSAGRVTMIIKSMLEDPELECLKGFSVEYRGETLR